MLFGKLSKSLILPLLLIAVLMGQVSRDETIQITYPTTGAVIDTNFVDATFNIADFFDLGPQAMLSRLRVPTYRARPGVRLLILPSSLSPPSIWQLLSDNPASIGGR